MKRSTVISPSRRSFLKGAAAAAFAAPLLVPARVLRGADTPSKKIAMAFIGTGNNGTGWMEDFLRDPRVRVVAVCDVNRESAGYWNGTVRGREPARKLVNKAYGDEGCAACEDFREILARKDIDAVYVGTPDHWHGVISVAAARAKKDILCQKPLSLTVAEGRAIADAAKENGVVLQTGSQQRSDAKFRRACELVRNGRIGKLHTVRCGLPGGTPDYGKVAQLTQSQPVPEGFNYDFWLGPAPEAAFCPARVGVNFRWNLDYSGGQLTDWGGHHPDIAQWGMGTDRSGPVRIENARGEFARGPIYNTAIHFHYECVYASGVRMIISDRERSGVTFEGAEGWIWVNRGQFEASSQEIAASPIGENEIRLYASDNHIGNFIDCVLSRKEPIAPAEIAHRSITIAHLGNIALQTGRDLRWDPERERFIDDEGADAMLRREMRKPWVV